jgi:hypothetical protein
MDQVTFDALARRAATRLTRRGAVAVVLSAALADLTPTPSDARAGNRKKKRGKPRVNQFGCVNVGNRCRGNNSLCCSGICQGRKPKKGEKDRSRCVGHDALSCQAGQDSCSGTDVACSLEGDCFVTTGKASFCGDAALSACLDCTKDRQCEANFGPGAACVVCDSSCAATGGRACVAAALRV